MLEETLWLLDTNSLDLLVLIHIKQMQYFFWNIVFVCMFATLTFYAKV